jgi:hypothetical protein
MVVSWSPYRREHKASICAWERTNNTLATPTLDAVGHVPWWPEGRRGVTLHHILLCVISDTQRHAGHADIVRELLDGSAGYLKGDGTMPAGDEAWWESHRRRLEHVARDVGNG